MVHRKAGCGLSKIARLDEMFSALIQKGLNCLLSVLKKQRSATIVFICKVWKKYYTDTKSLRDLGAPYIN